VMAVCQPGVPVLVAASLMAEDDDRARPASIILMGSPIDTRVNQTEPNRLAQSRPLSWFEKNVVTTVPWPNTGFLRRVYPGFMQLSGFMSMNMDRHVDAHFDHFQHLVEGDGDSVAAHRAFYDEYLAVMDLTAEFYLQTVKTVFQEHSLPKNEMIARWHPVLPEKINRTAILCVEGELDDISGVGQTKSALKLTKGLSADKKHYHLQKGVGHYGVFNGGKFRRDIVPVISGFIREHDLNTRAKAARKKSTKRPTRRAA
jgi:poly(3-hydroxybutyrate) depolymerase